VSLQSVRDVMKLSGKLEPRLFQVGIIRSGGAFFALSRLCAAFFWFWRHDCIPWPQVNAVWCSSVPGAPLKLFGEVRA